MATQGDGPRRHHDRLLAGLDEAGHVLGQRLEPGRLELAAGTIHQQAGADLDHDPARIGPLRPRGLGPAGFGCLLDDVTCLGHGFAAFGLMRGAPHSRKTPSARQLPQQNLRETAERRGVNGYERPSCARPGRAMQGRGAGQSGRPDTQMSRSGEIPNPAPTRASPAHPVGFGHPARRRAGLGAGPASPAVCRATCRPGRCSSMPTWSCRRVMIGLAFASLVTWSVWLAKSLELRAARRRLLADLTAVDARAVIGRCRVASRSRRRRPAGPDPGRRRGAEPVRRSCQGGHQGARRLALYPHRGCGRAQHEPRHGPAGDHRLHRPLRRPVRHGVGHHEQLRRHLEGADHQPRRGGARHRRGAAGHRHRPVRGHPGGHHLQSVRALDRRLPRAWSATPAPRCCASSPAIWTAASIVSTRPVRRSRPPGVGHRYCCKVPVFAG